MNVVTNAYRAGLLIRRHNINHEAGCRPNTILTFPFLNADQYIKVAFH